MRFRYIYSHSSRFILARRPTEKGKELPKRPNRHLPPAVTIRQHPHTPSKPPHEAASLCLCKPLGLIWLKTYALLFRREQLWRGRSVGFIRREQGCIHRLHAGGTGEGPHQPGVDAIHVVNVEAGQEPNRIAVLKIHHADYTPGAERNIHIRQWVLKAYFSLNRSKHFQTTLLYNLCLEPYSSTFLWDGSAPGS